MTIPVLDYHLPTTPPPRPLLGVMTRVLYALFGVLVPIVCFLGAAAGYPFAPEYQNDRWDRYLLMLPLCNVGWAFYPLLLLAMGCLVMFAGNPTRFSQRMLVRASLWGGVALAWQYTFLQAIGTASDMEPILACALGFGCGLFAAAIGWAWEYLGRTLSPQATRNVYKIGGGLLFVGILIAAVLLRSPVFLIIGALFLAPGLTLIVYVHAARRAGKLAANAGQNWRDSWLAPSAWIAGYAGAWAIAISRAIAEYQNLPLHPPSKCYIATAAANGHQSLVGWEIIIAKNGSGMRVNRQLRRLKFAEIALSAVAPATHRALRQIYDCLGKRAAQLLTSPLAADAAYLLLKPLEWIAMGAMVLVLPDAHNRAEEFYRND